MTFEVIFNSVEIISSSSGAAAAIVEIAEVVRSSGNTSDLQVFQRYGVRNSSGAHYPD
jgi:hypothetical protein